MKYYVNEGKQLYREAAGAKFLRSAVKTHFVQIGEDYNKIIEKYIKDDYQEGDIVSISEKIIGLCQRRIVYKTDIKIGFWAKFLSKFVHVTPAGPAVGDPHKMALAIKIAGLPRILLAAFCSAVTKLFGKKGVFYKVAGNDINGIDGFCDDAFKEYLEFGILNPAFPDKVCNEIKEKTGVSCMIVDANDLGVEILGKADDITYSINELKDIIRDNPAGQAGQSTPLIHIRKVSEEDEVIEPVIRLLNAS